MSNTTAFSDLHVTTMKCLESHEQIRDKYEHTLRDSLANGNLQQLLQGTVDKSLIHHSMTVALQAASDEAASLAERLNDLSLRDLSVSLWNPAVACLIQERKQSSPPPICKTSHRVSKPDGPGTRRSSVKAASAKKPLPPIVIDGNNPDLAHISELAACDVVYYRNFCTKAGCDFCRGMFSSLAITKCQDHPPCTKVGWYPHVGKSLLRMVVRSHSMGKPFIPRNVHDKSISALSGALSRETSKDASVPSALCAPQEVDYRSPSLEEDAFGSTLSLNQPVSWADVVERHTKSPCKRACSEPAPEVTPVKTLRSRKVYDRHGRVGSSKEATT